VSAAITDPREYACREQGCEFQIFELGPADGPFAGASTEFLDEIDEHERMHIGKVRGWIEDDGTEAEALAEVEPPRFPDVLVHGRAPEPRRAHGDVMSVMAS
jgi:hypothetical protein